MSRFWKVISVALLTTFTGLAWLLCSRPWRMKTYHLPLWAELLAYGLAATLVAILWAICFRRQVEELRPTRTAILTLVAVEAVFLWLAQTFDPGLFP